jgi:predicted short-subunit dehydrogenase-like oxidoreductase (DUF2520 family)
MQGITVVGPGRLGGALAIALSNKGFPIELLVFRKFAPARAVARQLRPTPQLANIKAVTEVASPIVLLTVSDAAIEPVAKKLSSKVRPKTIVFHTSGALASDVLDPFRKAGCEVASLHPLASISSHRDAAERFRGAFFCIEGDDDAVRLARRLVRHLGGRPFAIATEGKALYHAGAVCAAGHVVALFDTALSLMASAGISRRDAKRLLLPLLAGTVWNLEHQDTPAALTGTIARGDIQALQRQVQQLAERAEKADREVFLALAERSIDLAEKHGLEHETATKMRRLIWLAKRTS